ncbi:hypothetical protein AAY473_014565 [Plecturocebus cupreus]
MLPRLGSNYPPASDSQTVEIMHSVRRGVLKEKRVREESDRRIRFCLIPLVKEQVPAVFKDIFNLVWPEEQSAVQFDVLICKTHTVCSWTLFSIGWSAMVQSQLTATSASWIQEILLPQPPKQLGLQAHTTTPS